MCALKWAQAVLKAHPDIFYNDFFIVYRIINTKFCCVFYKGSSPDAAAHKMFHLRQGKRGVVDFYTDFWILAEETGWGENGL